MSCYLASFFSNDSNGVGIIWTFYSPDGETFTWLPWPVPDDVDASGGSSRDPSIFFNSNDGNFYLCCSNGGSGGATSTQTFSLYKATQIGGAWTNIGPVTCFTGDSSPHLWAPEWFQDSDLSVHVIFAYNPSGNGISGFKIYETHPTNAGFTTWSTPVLLASSIGYDPYVVIKSGTYYLFTSTAGSGGGVNCNSASSLTGTYSSAGISGLPSGGENPIMLLVGTTWTLYYDASSGAETTGQIRYQTATSSAWSSFNASVAAVFNFPPGMSTLNMKGGTVMQFAGLAFPGGGIPSQAALYGPIVSGAGSLASFAVDNNARLGFLRLGAGRLGAGPNPGSQDITFSGVAIGTHVAWFTPVVAGPLLPSKIPSQQAWFGPVINHLQTVDPAKIPTHVAWFTPVVAGPLIPTLLRGPRNWYNPTVAGPLSPSIIASRQAWFSPTVTVEQIIAPAAPIPTHASWPTTAKVSNVQTIRPSVIPTHASWPTPAVFGSPQYIVPIRGIPTNRSFPQNSVVSGGVYGALNPAIDGLQIFLGGVEVTKYALLLESNVPSAEPSLGAGGVAQSCTIQSQTIGRWQATFKLFDSTGTIAPSLAQTVMILDYGVKIFAGCIQMVEINRELSTSSAITFEITATDKSGICDHRVVAGTPDYPAGSDVAQTILDIVTNYLAGEGITTNNVPTDGSLGTLATDEQFNFNTVTQAFDQIATDNGLLWFVDVNGDLNFCTEDTFPEAPFDLTETSGNWRNLAVSLNLLNYRNKQYVVSNLSTLPGSGTSGNNGGGQGGGSSTGVVSETYTWNFASPGVPNPGIVMQVINGVPTLVGVQVQLPIQTIQSIVVSGGFLPQTVYELSNFNGQTSQALNDYLWSYLSSTDPNGLNTIADTQAFPEILLPLGATVTVNYVPGTNNAAAQTGATIVAVTPPGAPSVGGLGTCGSGIYEAVEQVQNVATQDGLQAIANAILSRYGGVPTTISFETDFPGLRPGQVITINIPGTYAPTAQFLITQIQGTHMSGNIGYGMSKGTVNGSFRWAIECSSILDPGNWVKWYENLIERTQNALPVYQYEEADFAIGLGGGGNIGNGLVSTNPYIVKRTGLLFDMHAAAATPPTNQDIVITFFRNGILIPGSVTIKGGSFANTDNVFTFPATTSLYVFANPPSGPNDIITIAANYRITGANPTPALNVTAFLRWRI